MNSNIIKIHCTDNGKTVEAEIVSQSDGWITTVMKPGDVKITLKRSKPNVYVGQLHGYEFVYKLNIS
jgi:hypothetical protein